MSNLTVVVAGIPSLADALERSGRFAQVLPVASTSGLKQLLQSRVLSSGIGDKVFVFADTTMVDTPQTLSFLIGKLTAMGAPVIIVAASPGARDLVGACPGAGLLEGPLKVNQMIGAISGLPGMPRLEPVADNVSIPLPGMDAPAFPAAPAAFPAAPAAFPAAPPPFPGAGGAPAPTTAPAAPWLTPAEATAPLAADEVVVPAPPAPRRSLSDVAAPAHPPFGQPTPEQPAPFGQPAPEPASPFGQPTPEPAQPPFGQPDSASPFGQPGNTSPFGQPAQEQPSPFGQPAQEQPSPFGQPAPGPASPFGQPAQEQPSPFGQPAPGPASPFGQPSSTSPFGQPAGTPPFGQPAPEPAHSPFGQPASASPFAQPGTPSGWSVNEPGMPGAPVARAGAPEVARPARRGHVVTVAAPKGGTGKSTMSLNLAAYLGLRLRGTGKNVCLIDANVQQADTGKYLNAYTPNIEGILKDVSAIHPDRINNYLLHKTELNLSALLGPATPEAANPLYFTGRRYTQILEALKPNYDYIIIDTPVAELYHDIFREFALPQADFIATTIAPNVPTLMNTDSWLRQITAPRNAGGMGVDPEKIGIVLNRAQDDIGLSEDEVRRELGEWRFLGSIPETKEWQRCNNRGELVAAKNYHELNEAFAIVLAAATGEELLRTTPAGLIQPTAGSGLSGLLGRILGRKG